MRPTRTAQLIALGVTLMTATASHAAPTTDPAEPPGASLAWTSDDPTIVRARHLIADGRFADAESLLRDGPSNAARQETLDVIARLRQEYPYTAEQMLDKLHKNGLPDLTAEQLDQWRDAHYVQWRTIDGQPRYFRREPANVNRFGPPAHKPGAPDNTHIDANDEHSRWTLVAHLKRIIAAADATGQPYVLPVRHTVKASITVPSGAPGMKPGALVRAWLPFPQEYGHRQYDVKLLSASPSDPQVAPTAQGDFPSMTGAPQRTAYFEQRAAADNAKALTFSITFQYTSAAYYPKLDDARAEPLPNDWSGGCLNERPPHIVFTPELKAAVAEAIGSETNPLVKARKIFHWIHDHVAYHAEEEYGVIPSFAEACLQRRRGDCGVQSVLFITMCRYANIPARWQSGFETKPSKDDMHDWAEFYVAPFGWLPADPSYGPQKSDDPRVRDFYCGHIDSYRLIVNRDYGSPLIPPKQSLRSEPADLQRGEVEIDGHNLYFPHWDSDMTIDRDGTP